MTIDSVLARRRRRILARIEEIVLSAISDRKVCGSAFSRLSRLLIGDLL